MPTFPFPETSPGDETMDALQEIGQVIFETCEMLDLLDAEIARMPALKRNSRFGRDRLAAREDLQRQLDRLYVEQDRLLAEKPAATEMHPVGRIPETFLAIE
jgi:hypothetical protein